MELHFAFQQISGVASGTVTNGHVIVSIERSSSGSSPLSVDSRREQDNQAIIHTVQNDPLYNLRKVQTERRCFAAVLLLFETRLYRC